MLFVIMSNKIYYSGINNKHWCMVCRINFAVVSQLPTDAIVFIKNSILSRQWVYFTPH